MFHRQVRQIIEIENVIHFGTRMHQRVELAQDSRLPLNLYIQKLQNELSKVYIFTVAMILSANIQVWIEISSFDANKEIRISVLFVFINSVNPIARKRTNLVVL